MANPNLLAATTASGTTTYLTPGGTSAVVLLPNAASSGQVFKINQIVAANVSGSAAVNATVSIYTNGAVAQGSAVLYVSPTMGQSRQIIWDLLLDLGREVIQSSHVNNLDITLINGARIYVRGADRAWQLGEQGPVIAPAAAAAGLSRPADDRPRHAGPAGGGLHGLRECHVPDGTARPDPAAGGAPAHQPGIPPVGLGGHRGRPAAVRLRQLVRRHCDGASRGCAAFPRS